MAGLLGFLAAGAAKGVGSGIVAEAKAKREAAIADLEHSRLVQREEASRSFQASESALERNSRARENALDRSATAEQGRLGRQETLSTADGTTMILDGDRARPVLDQEGTPVKSARTSSENAPAEVQTAEWLIRQGVAGSPQEAWTLMRKAREGDVTPKDVETMVEKAVDTELGGSMVPPSREVVDESRTRNRARILESLGMTPKPAEETSSNAAPAPAMQRPSGMSDEAIIQEARAAASRPGADRSGIASDLRTMGIDPAKAGL